MYYLTTPDRDNRHQLARIIPPRFRSCVEDDQGRADIVLIGAYVDHAPVGLLIGAPNESKAHSYTLCHLWVSRDYKDLGIERALLLEGERTIRTRGYLHMEMQPWLLCGARRPGAPPEAREPVTILHELGWNEVSFRHTSFHLSRGACLEISKEPWFRLEVPQDYELFFWRDIESREKELLRSKQGEPKNESRHYMDPLEVDPFDPLTSLALRWKPSGRIVGWMINDVVPESVLRFSRLYVLPSKRRQGLFPPLLSNSIALCLKYYAHATFEVAAANGAMRAAIVRMLGHWCDAIVDHYFCRKDLEPGRTPAWGNPGC
jgi:ribosomal protein S18 acetylase RimI-like enzyme